MKKEIYRSRTNQKNIPDFADVNELKEMLISLLEEMSKYLKYKIN